MNLLRSILSDARFALRLLRRNPGFSVTLLGVLIVGIGATTAMFSIVNSVLLRPLPYAHPEELTILAAVQPQVNPSPVSLPDFLDWKAGATSFATMTAVSTESYSLSSEGSAPEFLPGVVVSGDFFPTFGIAPLRGRLFGPEDDRVGAPRIAVISAALWRRRFAADPAAVGQTIMLNAEPYTIVGVAPEGFVFAGPNSNRSDVWIPLAVGLTSYASASSEDGRGSHFLAVMGRRRPGTTLAQAGAQLRGIAERLEREHPDSNTKVSARVDDLHEQLVEGSRDRVWALFGAVGLVFLVVCANVANLLLARASSRRAEMAARAALGATGGRLVMQLMTETVVVFVIASLGGTLLARSLVDFIASGLVLGAGAMTIGVHVDGAALAFAIGIAVVCGLVFGVVPAVEAYRVAPQAVLKESGARASLGRPARLLRGGLVIAQVALAVTLLAGSGLALRAFVKLASTPLGFNPEGIVTAGVLRPGGDDDDGDGDARIADFYREAVARIAAQPGVTSVAANTSIPMGNSNENGSFTIEGRPPFPAGSRPLLERNTITPRYFQTLGIPLLRGRDFTDADTKDGRLVMIISKATADKFFPGEDPIGRRIDLGDVSRKDGQPQWREIVGIVGDVHRLNRPVAVGPESYSPVAQRPKRWMTIVARTGSTNGLGQNLPKIVAGIDSRQAISDRRLMTDRVASSIRPQRFVAQLLGAFAGAGLLLATLGIFGLVAYTTNQRTRELGIRFALGSTPEGIVKVVTQDGLRLLGAGLAFGLVSALLTGRAIAGYVQGAAAFDPVLLASILGVVAIAGLLAALIPALRAIRIPPAVALRYE